MQGCKLSRPIFHQPSRHGGLFVNVTFPVCAPVFLYVLKKILFLRKCTVSVCMRVCYRRVVNCVIIFMWL